MGNKNVVTQVHSHSISVINTSPQTPIITIPTIIVIILYKGNYVKGNNNVAIAQKFDDTTPWQIDILKERH